MAEYIVRHVGDCALSVEFANEISLETNQKVCAMKMALEKQCIYGVQELIPSYRALLIIYDPLLAEWETIETAIAQSVGALGEVEIPKPVITEIPVLYEGEYAMDIEEIAKLENKTVEEVIRIHSESDYYVYMLGFSPGLPYTARLENPFSFGRRTSPRIRIPGGCVVVQKEQSNITPFPQPCGWNVIGTTPLLMCDYRHETPFLLKAGQWVRYVPIEHAEFMEIKRQVELDCYQCKTYEKEA